MDVQLYEGVAILFKNFSLYNFADNYNYYVHVPLVLRTTLGVTGKVSPCDQEVTESSLGNSLM